ncbi:MAG: hypothetical protein LPJ89_02710 [Hymenobacteraceae bacterium]|nr:hypothetical protein [Hymenobacteraceae bacterium]
MIKLCSSILLALMLTGSPAAVFAEPANTTENQNKSKSKILLNGKEVDSDVGVSIHEKGTFAATTSEGEVTKVIFYLSHKGVPEGKLSFTDKKDFSAMDLEPLLKLGKPGGRIIAEVYVGKKAQLIDIPLHD